MKSEKQRLLQELMEYWLDDLIESASTDGWFKGGYELGGMEINEAEHKAVQERVRVLRRKVLGYWGELTETDLPNDPE